MNLSLISDFVIATEKAIRSALDVIPMDSSGFGTMVRYPFGLVDEYGVPFAGQTGKRIRPALLLLCADATGCDWRPAVPAATAVELLHNFSLVHDDVQDNSPLRHGRPTVWRVWGIANAINVGDALFALSLHVLQNLSSTGVAPDVVIAASRLFTETALKLTRGQHLDMRFETLDDVSVDAYLEMIAGKTAALLGVCGQLGALIATGDTKRAEHFGAYALNVGMAFQIRDDILGIWGDEAVTGKSASSDIEARKKSLPVLHGLPASEELRDLYARPAMSPSDIASAVRILDEVGARDYAVQLEQHYTQQAMHALDRAAPTPEGREKLLALTTALFARSS
ncbi:MAG: polyprenyl synthetase family protein [Chloroflexi bacterium]|nr:polyprenyl synthetase family protein [Chloroflexota bacterium]